jgi:NADH:ubiquinone oxidoreductase subunit 2 (subunit N)
MNSVVSLYYYAKIIKTMFLDLPYPEDKTVTVEAGDFNLTLLVPLAALTVVFGVYFGPLLKYTDESLSFFIR